MSRCAPLRPAGRSILGNAGRNIIRGPRFVNLDCILKTVGPLTAIRCRDLLLLAVGPILAAAKDYLVYWGTYTAGGPRYGRGALWARRGSRGRRGKTGLKDATEGGGVSTSRLQGAVFGAGGAGRWQERPITGHAEVDGAEKAMLGAVSKCCYGKVEMSPPQRGGDAPFPQLALFCITSSRQGYPSAQRQAALTAPVRDAPDAALLGGNGAAVRPSSPGDGTFLLCRRGGHFYFAATSVSKYLTRTG